MKAKTLLDLLTLSSNLYLMSKDRELRNKLNEAFAGNKLKAEGEEGAGEEEEDIFNRLSSRLEEAREELENKVEKVALKVYKRMHIAHSNETKELRRELAEVKKALSDLEARIS